MTGWGSGDVNTAITVPAQPSPSPVQEQHKQIVVMSTLSTFPSIISRQILELSTKLHEVSQYPEKVFFMLKALSLSRIYDDTMLNRRINTVCRLEIETLVLKS